MEAAAINEQSKYTISQGYTYSGDDYWDWWAWVDGAAKDLDEIASVVYFLHPTFYNPVREIKDRSSKFKLTTKGWGTFTLNVKINLKNGNAVKLVHELLLEYPDSDMKVLAEINVSAGTRNPAIQLILGDLTGLPKKHATDILVISAYPKSYAPLENTLIGALAEKGIDVAALAADKEVDLTEQLNCWISKPLDPEKQDQFNIKRILCFEAGNRKEGQNTVVDNIYRCINAVAFDEGTYVVAMPILAAGAQKVPLREMLPAILDASIFWLEQGLPLECIKLMVHTEKQADEALPIFLQSKQQYSVKQSLQTGSLSGQDALKMFEMKNDAGNMPENSMPLIESGIKDLVADPLVKEKREGPVDEEKKYDFFISYAYQQREAVAAFVNALNAKGKSKKIFFDKDIKSGSLWIKEISQAIANSDMVICILTPDYINSSICWDEFQAAKVKEYNTKKSVIRTILFKDSPEMPAVMGIYSYIDCREGNVEKLKESAIYFL